MGSQGIRARIGNAMPAAVAVPLRHRFGPSREREMELIGRFCPAGSMCVDIGANKGTWTYGMAKAVGPDGHVLALEPQPELVAYLQSAFGNTRQVEIQSVAASDVSGTVTLQVPTVNGRSEPGLASLDRTYESSTAYEVATDRLDDIVGERAVAFIKIDVEGHELSVLSGATAVLTRSRPTLVVELTDVVESSGSRRAYDLLSVDFGYRPHVYASGHLAPINRWPYWDANRSAQPTPNAVFLP